MMLPRFEDNQKMYCEAKNEVIEYYEEEPLRADTRYHGMQIFIRNQRKKELKIRKKFSYRRWEFINENNKVIKKKRKFFLFFLVAFLVEFLFSFLFS